MRLLLHETVTGELADDLEFTNVTWSTGICRPDTVSATLPGYTGQELYKYMVPKVYTVTPVEDDGRVRGAGVLSLPEGKTDTNGINRVVFPGTGVETIFDRRVILPALHWPLINAEGYPVKSRDTNITGVQYGTMMKMLYQQAMSHYGGSLPVAWEPDRAGTREKSWSAVDGKSVQSAVNDISNLIGGVEWDWVPQIDENDRLYWQFLTGTDSTPEITSSYVHTWQSGGEKPSIRNLTLKVSPEFMCQTAFFTGGKEDDRVMISRATGTALIEAGVPLSEVWDSSHSSVSRQATLDQWAENRFEEGAAPVQYYSFEVRDQDATTLRHGDWCQIDVYNHWLVPDGSYNLRVMAVSGNSSSDWLSVTVGGLRSW